MSFSQEEQLELAKQFARKKHSGQTDKAGKPYFEHVEYVASKQNTVTRQIIGYLHDIIEDTDTSELELVFAGFDSNIIESVMLLTHIKGEPYMKYIDRLSTNDDAVYVKYQDLLHNSQLSRLSNITNDDKRRQRKYMAAIYRLKENRPELF